MKRIGVLVISSFLLFSSLIIFSDVGTCEETSGNTLYVDDSGGKDYTKIQDAINNATDGDTIYVWAGTYDIYSNGFTSYRQILIDKSLTIIGNSSVDTFIIGGFEVVTITADWTNISGFTIMSMGTNPSGIHIYCGIEVINADNCRIENNNISSAGWGIFLYNSDNNTITQNIVSSSNYGIQLYNCSNNIIYYNNFNNTENGKDDGENSWYNSALNKGNYWSDYNGSDENGDGVGDTPYEIPDGDNVDEYPLMMPYNGSIRIKEYYVDEGLLYTMLIVGIIASILFCLPIAYFWYRKYYKIK